MARRLRSSASGVSRETVGFNRLLGGRSTSATLTLVFIDLVPGVVTSKQGLEGTPDPPLMPLDPEATPRLEHRDQTPPRGPDTDQAELQVESVSPPPRIFNTTSTMTGERNTKPRSNTPLNDREHHSRHLTLRISCGARAQPRFRHRPPARRQLEPVVRRHRPSCHGLPIEG